MRTRHQPVSTRSEQQTEKAKRSEGGSKLQQDEEDATWAMMQLDMKRIKELKAQIEAQRQDITMK